MARLAVIGGGPAGLTAALVAAEAGHDVTVVERSRRLGGMAASVTVSGQRVDLGSHRLHPVARDDVRALLDRLLGADLQSRIRNGRIRIGGRWVRFPLSAGDLVRQLPPRFAASAALDAVVSPLRTERADTYAEVIRAGLGPSVLDWFYGPYAEKLWGCPPSDLHGDVARRRVAVASPAELASKLVRARLDGPPRYLYPRNGYGQIVDELAAAGRRAAVSIVTGATVTSVAGPTGSASMEVGYESDGGRSRSLVVDRVFWTAAPHHLGSVIEAAEPAPTHRPRHRALVLAYLTVAGERYTPFDAHYLPETDLVPARLSEPKNYRDGDDPADRSVLCAELPCDPGDELWQSDDDAIGRLVAAALERTQLPPPVVTGVHVERLPAVYPVLRPVDVEPLRRLSTWAEGLDGVTVFGRQGLVVADNLHHVMAMALDAVACLADDGSWDRRAWARARARFDDHVVED